MTKKKDSMTQKNEAISTLSPKELLKKLPGREYLQGRDELRMPYAKLIRLLHDAFGSDGWKHEVVDVSSLHKTKNDDGTYEASYSICSSLTIHGVGTQQTVGTGFASKQQTQNEAIQMAMTSARSHALSQVACLFGDLTGNCLHDKETVEYLKTLPKPPKRKFDESMVFHHPST
ncbi:hypothetical protein LRAMOSA02568 [Lichtheimia ramosa]|uniref:Uncharacterized protein n=1 Tax=Lichtheimia ramosa TaxID=688394 RepID=A0A077WQK3_9FUNG|nr:hypothetical protein LRAMOSA02568 [Lichtheimia ramosa]